MAVTTKQVRRYRGMEIVLLRRLIKTVEEIERHNVKYPQAGPPAPVNRRHLDFSTIEMATASELAAKSLVLLHVLYPPDT